jgi:5'-nucleotidase
VTRVDPVAADARDARPAGEAAPFRPEPSRALRGVARPLDDWPSPPRILVTNDDGVESSGLLALARAMRTLGDVTVMAPETNQSTVGHMKTLMRPLRIRERRLADGSEAWAIDGSPTDAVSAAFLGYFGHGFDLVASGVNQGPNLGDDVTYSGTVSAAMEATISGCPAFAVSQTLDGPAGWALAEMAAAVVARNILERGLDAGELLNVNVPALPPDACAGFRVTHLGRRIYHDVLVERLDPRGQPYYWIGGPPPAGVASPGTDVHAIQAGFVSVTPIHLDLTARAILRRLREWDLALPAGGAAGG